MGLFYVRYIIGGVLECMAYRQTFSFVMQLRLLDVIGMQSDSSQWSWMENIVLLCMAYICVRNYTSNPHVYWIDPL